MVEKDPISINTTKNNENKILNGNQVVLLICDNASRLLVLATPVNNLNKPDEKARKNPTPPKIKIVIKTKVNEISPKIKRFPSLLINICQESTKRLLIEGKEKLFSELLEDTGVLFR